MTEQRLPPEENERTGELSLATVADLLSRESTDEIYRWGAELLNDRIGADICKVATATDGLLIPVVSTNGGKTGREQAIPIATTIPGSVFATGEGCTVPDLEAVRGSAASAQTSQSRVRPEIKHRSMVCAAVGDFGVLVGLATEPHAFGDEDLEVATAIGDVMASAISSLGGDGATGEPAPDRMLEEIANMVSHDLRNKLNILSGRIKLARDTGETEHFDACVEAIEGVESIADMVVTIARTGRPLEQIVETDLRDACVHTFDALSATDAELVVKASATILADRRCLSQLLENLFRNAIEHSEKPVHIEVGLLADGFYISDDGPGIPDDVREDVFDLGYTTSDGNTGKGLAIVRRMAEAHGWDVELTESTVGGARVEIHNVVFQ